jgi:flagellar hook-associated protein 3 FlgL
MTISTNLWYNRANTAMQTLSAKADAANVDISSTKKLHSASDDPVAYTQLRGLATANADGTAYGKNLDTAASVLSSTDTTLASIGDQITAARELALKANNGTYSDTDRASMAEALLGIVDTLASLGNTQDTRGLPLFGDSNGTPGVTKAADGSYSFASGKVTPIPIGDGQTIEASTNAARVFGVGDSNILQAITDFATALQAGGDLGEAGTDAIATITNASDGITTLQASVGARASRVELEQTAQTSAANRREVDRSALEDTNIATAIIELQKTMTILSATQASFTKLQSLSLFDYLK